VPTRAPSPTPTQTKIPTYTPTPFPTKSPTHTPTKTNTPSTTRIPTKTPAIPTLTITSTPQPPRSTVPSLITSTHRYQSGFMFGGWGPHLGHLMRASALMPMAFVYPSVQPSDLTYRFNRYSRIYDNASWCAIFFGRTSHGGRGFSCFGKSFG
jgi:hypothetical protein